MLSPLPNLQKSSPATRILDSHKKTVREKQTKLLLFYSINLKKRNSVILVIQFLDEGSIKRYASIEGIIEHLCKTV